MLGLTGQSLKKHWVLENKFKMTTYELIIIGGGPAGVAAGVYAARKKIKTALITKDFLGQSIVSPDIQNWIGDKSISGMELAQKMEEHLRAQEGIDIFDGEIVALGDTEKNGALRGSIKLFLPCGRGANRTSKSFKLLSVSQPFPKNSTCGELAEPFAVLHSPFSIKTFLSQLAPRVNPSIT